MIVSGAATQQKPFQLSEARGSDLLQQPGLGSPLWGECAVITSSVKYKVVSVSDNIFLSSYFCGQESF